MTGAYDCNYDFVDNPKQALVEAHEEIRELESQHAADIARLRLTDAEREAINVARIELNTLHCFENHYSHILKNLLARLA